MVSRSHLLENNVGRNLALSKLCNLISRRSLLHSCFTAIVHNISFPLLLALNSLSEYLMVSLRVLLPVDGPSAHHRGSFFSHSNSSLAPGIKLFHHDKNLPCLKNSYHHLQQLKTPSLLSVFIILQFKERLSKCNSTACEIQHCFPHCIMAMR